MPRVRSHQTGDIGENKIESLFLEQGWVSNRCSSDYGEDLALQPAISGHVEKFRVYVQVKAISDTKKKSYIEIRKDLLRHWLLSRDFFIVCCWLVKEKIGLCAWPGSIYSLTKLEQVRGKNCKIPLNSMIVLDAKKINDIACDCRDRYYGDVLNNLMEEVDRFRKKKNKTRAERRVDKEYRLRIVGISRQILEEAGAVENRGNDTCNFNTDFMVGAIDDLVEQYKTEKESWPLSEIPVRIAQRALKKLGHSEISFGLLWGITGTVTGLLAVNPGFTQFIHAAVKGEPLPPLPRIRSRRASRPS